MRSRMPSRRGLLLTVLLAGAMLAVPATAATTPSTVGPPIIAPSGGSTQTTAPSTVSYGPAPSMPIGNASDPGCKVPGITLQAQRACAGSGSTLSPFPTDNFQLDVHVNAGITDPGAWFPSFVQNVLTWLWGMMVSVVGWVFSALGAAFGFNLFGADHAGRIPGTLHGISGAFTEKWLGVALAIGGLWALYHWMRHDESKAVGHLLGMVVLMVVASVLILDPVGLLGGVSRDSSAMSGDVLAVFSTGHDGGSGSFGSAEPGLWSQSVERAWCALEFGKDTNWCMSPIGSETASWRADALANVAKADKGSSPQVQQDERRRLRLAKTNGELWLAFPANDDARNGANDSWTLYHHLLKAHPELAAIRGSGGIGSRSGTFVLIAIGLVPFGLLLGYIMLHLIAAAIVFVLLLLMTAVMIFAPAFGEGGRKAFARWAGGLGVTLFLQIGYAACLGVLLLVSGLLVPLAGGGTFGWLLWALLWVVAWMHRAKVLQAFTLGFHQQAHSMVYRRNFRREHGRMGAVRGLIPTPAPLSGHREWRKPGEWTQPAPVRIRQPMPEPQPAVIEGRAHAIESRSEPPALPVGEA